ncbi:unnamed protein product [marine sediment metagenome]|uniref:Nucleoside phosphorylase domain-containing protein n=2 Tax=marine sediment metagenome TaxID=412755 RepID=X1A6A6_9ZZZZ
MPIHVRANKGDFAKYCLLPGNPDRAKYVAEKFFDNPKLVTEYRRMFGYTGTYKGIPVSVQTTGMGCPSAAIITEELIMLGVKNFIRIGTCGAIGKGLKLIDLIIATGSVPIDGTTKSLFEGDPFAPVASFPIVHQSVHEAEKLGIKYHTGLIATSDLFYGPDPEIGEGAEKWAKRGVLAFEMEASILFSVAVRAGVNAGCLLTVSDIVSERIRAEDSEIAKGVDNMTKVALETIYQLETMGK